LIFPGHDNSRPQGLLSVTTLGASFASLLKGGAPSEVTEKTVFGTGGNLSLGLPQPDTLKLYSSPEVLVRRPTKLLFWPVWPSHYLASYLAWPNNVFIRIWNFVEKTSFSDLGFSPLALG